VARQETHYNSRKPGWQLTATAVEGARDLIAQRMTAKHFSPEKWRSPPITDSTKSHVNQLFRKGKPDKIAHHVLLSVT